MLKGFTRRKFVFFSTTTTSMGSKSGSTITWVLWVGFGGLGGLLFSKLKEKFKEDLLGVSIWTSGVESISTCEVISAIIGDVSSIILALLWVLGEGEGSLVLVFFLFGVTFLFDWTSFSFSLIDLFRVSLLATCWLGIWTSTSGSSSKI